MVLVDDKGKRAMRKVRENGFDISNGFMSAGGGADWMNLDGKKKE